jgi:tetratricopeptide (TPR) repeat protein
MTRLTLFIVVLSLLIGCNNDKESSAFGELLSQPPYASLTDSIKKSPGNDELYFRRAVLLNRNDLQEPALADFKHAWSLKKDERYGLGISNILLEKKPDSAAAFASEALKVLPQSILLRLSLARSYNAIDKPDDALKIAEEILRINPEQVDVLIMKSDLLEKKGQSQEAIAVLEKAYQLTPYDVELNYNLAYKYAESKNPKVIQLADSLARQDSLKIHAEPYYYKGLYYSNAGDKAKAISMFDEAIKHDYYFKNAYIEKGRVLYEQKKYAEAYTVFNLVMTLSPSFPDAYFWMAKCQEAQGDKASAKTNYERAYGLDKTFTEAKEAADRIR